MKKFIPFFLILFTSNFLYCQDAGTDSLKNLLTQAKDDSDKIVILGKLIDINIWSDPEQALTFAQQKLLLARKTKRTGAEIEALAENGNILAVLGDYSHSIVFFLQSIKLSEKSGYTIAMVLNYQNLSKVYNDAGDYNNALHYAYKSKSINDTMRLTDSFSYFLKELCSTYIGQVFEKSDQLDSALSYLRKAHEIDSIYRGSQTAFTTLHLANVYAKKDNAFLALKYYKEVIAVCKQYHIQKDLMDAYNGIAKTFTKNGQTDSAVFYAKQTLLVDTFTTYPLAVLNAVTLLSDIYKSKNYLDSTVKYIALSILIKDSLFNREKIRAIQNVSFDEQMHQQELQQTQLKYRNRLNVYLLLSGVMILVIIAGGLWRRNIFRQKSFEQLQMQKQEIDNQKKKVDETLANLRSTQAQLIQSEKMASLGELTAGIAHEIQNPLNFVNNFSEINKELIEEVKSKKSKLKSEELDELLNDIAANDEKINHHGKRADSIVKGMLQHSRSSTGAKEPTDINALADEYLRLSYHGLRAKDKDFNATMKTDFDKSIGKINIIPQDIGRVLMNLYNNAFYAVNENKKRLTDSYEPLVSVSTKKNAGNIEVKVTDNGNGIPQNIVDKIFQPFYTTKPTGQGTGLGLSLSYDIVKAHGGEIKVESVEKEGSEFIIKLPV